MRDNVGLDHVVRGGGKGWEGGGFGMYFCVVERELAGLAEDLMLGR